MVKITRCSCRNKKLHEFISEQEITDTIITGNTRKNFAAEINLLPEPKESQKNGARIMCNFFCCWLLQLDKIILLEALTTTNESSNS